ncbi:heme ABC exporter ATP-binding protein CcmA [Quisquiliibacterium transsilvanicum]|uniref:Heme exporter protein A n=1 Tax=Quisquiliibacterium transsilvanicum TaxID=1549638 RepID=A0A7W8HI57_9BURK|nr:heme ABC exporter ATP-binding protein CcmA [Quisquiliibacterium transsilvanicum]MBB5272317.1 heme exporter protein A [Quisquiliibacterium transsilvanicum]
MTQTALEAIDLGCTLGNRRLFAGLDFSLDAGRWLMLTGANGSGKSTLLRIVAGLAMPSQGKVRWQGRTRRAGDPGWNAAFVYQGHAPGWKDQLTARENLETQAWLDLAVRRDAPNAVDAAIAEVGLQRQRNLPFARLSAGQRRRLGLARLALAPRPLWLLDEPTTALDTEGQALFAGLLDRHLARGGCAVVATHLDFPTSSPSAPLRLGEAAPARQAGESGVTAAVTGQAGGAR